MLIGAAWYLRPGPLPRPGDGVQLVGVADTHGLHGHARVEGAVLEGDEARTVGARALREDEHLQPVCLIWFYSLTSPGFQDKTLFLNCLNFLSKRLKRISNM